MQIYLDSARLVFFFKDRLDKPQTMLTSAELLKRYPDLPTVVPIPEAAALDSVPVIQMKSSMFKLNFARQQASLTWADEPKPYTDNVEYFNDIIEESVWLLNLLSNQKISVIRIGFVCNFYASDPEPNLKISQLISDSFKRNISGKTYESTVSYSTQDRVGLYEVNNLTQLAGGIKQGDGTPDESVLIILRDINTLPDKNYDINSGNVTELVTGSINLLNVQKIAKFVWP